MLLGCRSVCDSTKRNENFPISIAERPENCDFHLVRRIFLHKKSWKDGKLLESYRKKNDSEALGYLFDRYLHLVYGLCLKYLKSREKSQDAVMDIYEKVSHELLEKSVTHFKSWLYVVAKNHCLMKLRKNNPEIHSEVFMENASEMHLNNNEVIEDQLSRMEKCIEKLKNGQKECITLFYLKEKSYREIAKESKYSLNEIKSFIQNGKRNLKICMENTDV